MASQRQINNGSTAISSEQHLQAMTTFLASKSLTPTSAWLQDFLHQSRGNVPLSSLQQTALWRLLATDMTVTMDATTKKFPSTISDPNMDEQHIAGPIVVQLLDIEDIGSSAWSQIEAIESQERGETTRGNQVIRTLPDENNDDSTVSTGKSRGPHKLLLQDAAGTLAYAFEMKPIEKLDMTTAIGLKLVLRGCLTARGIILLEPSNVCILGGKIEAMDRKWRAEHKQRLQQKVAQTSSTNLTS